MKHADTAYGRTHPRKVGIWLWSLFHALWITEHTGLNGVEPAGQRQEIPRSPHIGEGGTMVSKCSGPSK